MNRTKATLTLIGLGLLAACAPAPQGAEGAGQGGPQALRAVQLDDISFVVRPVGPGAASWCAAGRHAQGELGLPGATVLENVGRIGRQLKIGGESNKRKVNGPGVIYTTERGSIFDFINNGPADRRTVAEALAACG